MRLIEFSNQSVSFADCKAILLMLRWRAISSSKYISIDASIISIYSLSAAPLVVTRKMIKSMCLKVFFLCRHNINQIKREHNLYAPFDVL